MDDMDYDLEGGDGAMLNMYQASKATKAKLLAADSKRSTIDSPKAPAASSPAVFSPAVEAGSEKYTSRAKSGDTVLRFKCKDSSGWEIRTEKNLSYSVDVLPTSNLMSRDDYKYMFEKLTNISDAVEDSVQVKGISIFDQLGDEKERRSTLKDPSVDEGIYLGRIRNDGKLTSGSVFFEGCLDYSDGHIVNLDLSALDDYSVFPGQVAVIEGKNELGKCVRVNKIHLPKALEHPELKLDSELDQLSVLIAAGPYTPSDSLKFEPLKDLAEVILSKKPDVCILLGPFLEAHHKLVESEVLPKTFDEMFEEEIKTLHEKIKHLNTRILIVSSFKDAHADMVFPTPPYASISNLQNVTMLPDPAIVKIGSIVIGMTSTDVLMHLGRTELSQSTITGDRMGRLARHLITQRTFYPLHPSDEVVPMDMEHCVNCCKLDVNPHILVLPSDLRHFIKDVDGTVVVNPERLTKGSSGGTYGRLLIDLSSIQGATGISSVADYCIGEINKI